MCRLTTLIPRPRSTQQGGLEPTSTVAEFGGPAAVAAALLQKAQSRQDAQAERHGHSERPGSVQDSGGQRGATGPEQQASAYRHDERQESCNDDEQQFHCEGELQRPDGLPLREAVEAEAGSVSSTTSNEWSN